MTYKSVIFKDLQKIQQANAPRKIDMTAAEFFALPVHQQRQLRGHHNDWRYLGRIADTPVEWSRELQNKVMLGEQCPMCLNKTQYLARYKCELTGTYKDDYCECFCCQLKHKFRVLSQPWALPPRYLWADLETLKPDIKSTLSPTRQEQELEFLRQNPDDSYFFCGRPGSSKTTYCCVMLRRAYERQWEYLYSCIAAPLRPSWMWIWRINFDTYISQLQRRMDEKGAPAPDVTPDRIRDEAAKGKRPVLCIEELDKARMSEFRANKLFELVDAIYNVRGQLLITTNLTPKAFSALVEECQAETGGALMRRITEMCHVRNYFQ